MVRRPIIETTDPPRAPRGPVLPRSIFDPRPHRNVGMTAQRYEVRAVPDEQLIAILVAHGMPRWAAEETRRNPYRRFQALTFWAMVSYAAQGNKEAKQFVERAREGWRILRKVEMVSDHPGRSIGLWDR